LFFSTFSQEYKKKPLHFTEEEKKLSSPESDHKIKRTKNKNQPLLIRERPKYLSREKLVEIMRFGRKFRSLFISGSRMSSANGAGKNIKKTTTLHPRERT